MGKGPTFSQDIREAIDILSGAATATGPIDSTGGFKIGGTLITATAAEINTIDANVVKAGSYTAVADDATADTLDIVTGLSSVTSYVVFILRAGVPIYSDQAISESEGTITVADGAATYAITADDVINWIAVGAL